MNWIETYVDVDADVSVTHEASKGSQRTARRAGAGYDEDHR